MTVGGDVLVAASAGYESARRPQIARFDHVRPRAVVRCRGPEDVARALAHAHDEGLHVALRSGGHCFAGRSSTTGIVIDVGGMNEVSVFDGTVSVGAGARLADIYDVLAAHDRTIAAGCGPTVGIAGLTLGGGLGILGRSHGLTSDQLVAARAVLADGRVVECDEHRHEDLFWALRGAGGGQFAAVTQLVLRTIPAANATAFHLVWPWTAGAAVVDAWQAWAPDAPDAVAASLLARAPADSDLPPTLVVFGAVLERNPSPAPPSPSSSPASATHRARQATRPAPTATSSATLPSTTSAPASGDRSSASPATPTPSRSSSGASFLPT